MKKLRGNPKIILSIIKKDCLKTGICIKKNGIIEITGVSKNRVIKLK